MKALSKTKNLIHRAGGVEKNTVGQEDFICHSTVTILFRIGNLSRDQLKYFQLPKRELE
jgi:hypothetical protein